MQDTKSVDFKYYLGKIFYSAENIIIPILAFFAPVQGILLTVGLFILFDTAMGIWKSKKNKIPVTSSGLSAIISKMLLYETCILITYCLDVYIIGDIIKTVFSTENLLTKVVAMILIYIEAKSINENYKAVKGINLWTEFRSLLARTKEIKEDITGFKKEGDKK